MRRFWCERCGGRCSFDALWCETCSAALGYLPEELRLCVLQTSATAATYTVRGSGQPLWRCLNAAWGCNWMLPADGPGVWCRSCRLTRGRPDASDEAALVAWSDVEVAKRELVHQLDALGLPIVERTTATPDGLAFDLVYLPGRPEVTGFYRGVVTLDLTEADGGHRDHLRRQFGEPLRTLIGHLRHEMGHYYWNPLVWLDGPGTVDAFRALFGDERTDYGLAIASHHGSVSAPSDEAHITPYARAHPLEDWAETFAHYLHIRDALETAVAADLVDGGSGVEPDQWGNLPFEVLLEDWQRVADGLNAVAASLGVPPLYPISPKATVVEKLSFVHARVGAFHLSSPSPGPL